MEGFLARRRFYTRDDYLMSRYEQTGDTEKWERVRQRAVFDTVCKACLLLTGEKQGQAISDGVIKQGCFIPEKSEYYLSALNICNEFSASETDIFLPLRTLIRFGCARSLFWEGNTEKGFAHLNASRCLLEKMWSAKGSVLFGSTDYNKTVEIPLTDDAVIGTVLNIWKCESCIEFDCVREDERFTKFFGFIDNLIPESGDKANEFENTLDFIGNID